MDYLWQKRKGTSVVQVHVSLQKETMVLLRLTFRLLLNLHVAIGVVEDTTAVVVAGEEVEDVAEAVAEAGAKIQGKRSDIL
mmetsp:Transcript_16135/g.24181  ORF Transcript_16135/g.24181 Transcript_16135/m.24181 type:complete len:81 (-) Transcript_16135:166-408(-)